MATKTELLLRVASLERENEPLSLALHDLCNGNVHWVGRSPYRIGLSRVTGATGGIVIVCADNSTSAHYWEEWARTELEHIGRCISGDSSDYNAELMRRRSVIEGLQRWAQGQRALSRLGSYLGYES